MADPDPETLTRLLARLGIRDWDVLLAGDGSGAGWDGPAGWGTVCLERDTMERTVYFGTVNRGTVNFAELMAYVQVLDALSCREEDRRKAGGTYRAFQIHIVTDSDYCRRTGSKGDRTMKKNAGLWATLEAYTRHGFVLHWHHVHGHKEGAGCALNEYADALSKLARLLGKGTDLRAQLAAKGRDVNRANPG